MMHYIDIEFKFYQKLITFEQIYDEHISENFVDIIYDFLNKNNLCKKLYYIIINNIINNNIIIKSLSDILEREINVI